MAEISIAIAAAIGPVGCGVAHAQEHAFSSHGTNLHYLDVGHGEPIVLLHGLTGDYEVEWVETGVVQQLSQSFRVIALDERGHGKSEKPHDSASYGIQLSEDVARLLDELHIAKANIVGYSMGSIVAGKFAATHPDRVLSVTFGGLAPDPTFVAPPPGTPPPPLPEPTPEERQEVMKRTDPEAIGALMVSLGQLAMTSTEVKALDVPLLAVVGSDDPLRATVDAFALLRPKLKVLVVPGATHSGAKSAQRNPAFAAAVREFVTDK